MDRARHQCRDPLSLPYLRDRADALENQRRDLPCYTESQKKECRDREAAVIKVQTDVSRLETELLENLSFSRKRERQLSESAERLVEAVDRRFFELCRQLGLSGCVGLVRGRDALDFRGFGVDIRVMFGAASEMMRLSGEVQSGGEKSVCTALYLMALQEMPSASAPFRWVDEINQGKGREEPQETAPFLIAFLVQHIHQKNFVFKPLVRMDVGRYLNFLSM